MWIKTALLILFVSVFVCSVQASREISRKGAKAQSRIHPLNFTPLPLCGRNEPAQTQDLAVEVFQVLELPLNIHEASLVKSEKGYTLKLSLANSSELRMIGLRYSLVVIDFANQARALVNRTEGFSMRAYATKSLTFKTPIRFTPKDGERLVLMLEQVVSRESIWEVVKAKEAFEAYAQGDYSVMPVVLRVANQVDAPPTRPRVIYER
jgi:hypothetical protein